MNSYEIRVITENQLGKCSEIIRKGFGTVAEDFKLTAENCPTNGAFITEERLSILMQKGILMYGLFTYENIIGFVSLEQKNDKFFELEKITVLPEFRHFGYGKILLDFARNKVKQLGGNKITIGIIEENTVLKNWYAANGFIHTGTRVFEHLPFNVGFMELFIDNTI